MYSALYGIGIFSGHSQNGFRAFSNGFPVLMEIGDLEINRKTGKGGHRPRNPKLWVCKNNYCRSRKHYENERKILFNNGDTKSTAGENPSKL